MRIDDFIITVAYFSIPLQLVSSLYRYPRLASMPLKILVLCILFAFFILLCGCGHLMRCLNRVDGTAFLVLNGMTSIVSLITALYLLPLVPSLMSELDKSLQDLVKLNEETAESKRKLFTFMSFLCHEIRNPLFAITANIEFAQDMEMQRELNTSMNSIHQSATLMLRLVNDVLDLSKIESGKLELEEQEFNIEEFFCDLASTMGRQIEHKSNGNVKFVYNAGPNMPKIVKGDSVRLLQIAHNILSNACKFTEVGSITFSVSVGDSEVGTQKGSLGSKTDFTDSDISTEGDDIDEAGDFSLSLLQNAEEGRISSASVAEGVPDAELRLLQMKFEDTGIGIPKERINRIFEPYAQSKLSDYRHFGGTGLGLSIISKLTELMAGTIQAHSVEHEGSTFTVCLPILVPINQGLTKRNSFARADDFLESSAEAQPPVSPTPRAPLLSDQSPGGSPRNSNTQGGPLFSIGTAHSTQSRAATEPTASTPLAHSIPPNASYDSSSSRFDHPAPLPRNTSSMNQLPPVSPTSSPPAPASSAGTSNLVPVPIENTNATGNGLVACTSNAKVPTALFAAPNAISMNPLPNGITGVKHVPPTLQNKNAASRPPKAALPKFRFEKNRNVVLVTDDNAVNRKLLGRMLSYFNIEHQQAEHGKAAVDIMRQSRNLTGEETAPHFGLVFMDLSMPVMDGYEAIEALRSMGLDVPIVALTANALQQEQQKALSIGATEFATKPILRPVLHSKCKQYLEETPLDNTTRKKEEAAQEVWPLQQTSDSLRVH